MSSLKLDQPVRIAGIKFGNCLLNGAYIGSKTLKDIQLLASSRAGAVVVGSITVKPRKPNSSSGYLKDKTGHYSLNSFGMPNGGLAYFSKNLTDMADIAHQNNKPLIANVAGFSAQEFLELVKLVENSGADMAELNFGCPNVWDKGRQKSIISYSPELMKEILALIKSQNFKIKIIVKLSPLPPDTLAEVAGIIADSKIVAAVTATNSYPNAYAAKAAGLMGLSGPALKPISLGMVKQLRVQLPKRIDIIGCGGVGTAQDAKDFLEVGASAVQLATALVSVGPKVFESILRKS